MIRIFLFPQFSSFPAIPLIHPGYAFRCRQWNFDPFPLTPTPILLLIFDVPGRWTLRRWKKFM